jgi:hypothetical protein
MRKGSRIGVNKESAQGNKSKSAREIVDGSHSTASSLLSLRGTLRSITSIAEPAASMMTIWAGTAIPTPIGRDLVVDPVTRHVEYIT